MKVNFTIIPFLGLDINVFQVDGIYYLTTEDLIDLMDYTITLEDLPEIQYHQFGVLTVGLVSVKWAAEHMINPLFKSDNLGKIIKSTAHEQFKQSYFENQIMFKALCKGFNPGEVLEYVIVKSSEYAPMYHMASFPLFNLASNKLLMEQFNRFYSPDVKGKNYKEEIDQIFQAINPSK